MDRCKPRLFTLTRYPRLSPPTTQDLENDYPSVAVATTSLSQLPTELIDLIFESTDSFATVSALSRTSHRFKSICAGNLSSIRDALIPRVIDCLDQARELVDAREKASRRHQSPRGQIKAYVGNAKTAQVASLHYENDVIRNEERHELSEVDTIPPRITMQGGSIRKRGMTNAERTSFLKAWYRAMTLATMKRWELPYKMLTSLDMLAFKQLEETLRWFLYHASIEVKLQLRIGYSHQPSGGNLCSRNMPRRTGTAQNLQSVYNEFQMMSPLLSFVLGTPAGKVYGRNGNQKRSYYYWMLHELYMTREESGEGIQLAEGFPFIPWRT